MVYYDYLNFELVIIKIKRIDFFKENFLMLIWFCDLFHLKHENIFVSTFFFLKLCAIWVHVTLRVVNTFIIFSINKLVVVDELVVRKFRSWKFNENKKIH
jgi:hypothetical protein